MAPYPEPTNRRSRRERESAQSKQRTPTWARSLQDLRYAVRAFARTPGFTAAAILSIALGIGANTFIFSVASALLLRPLPYEQADRLVILWNRSPGLGIAEDWFSTAQYFDIKTNVRGLEQTAIAIGGNYNLTDGGEPERIGTIRVSSNLLSDARRARGSRTAVHRQTTTGRTSRGRRCSATAPGCGDTAAIPRCVGRTLTLNGLPYQVIGVLPASFDLPREVMPTLYGAEHAEILIPLPLGPKAAEIRTAEDYNIIGRLKSGVTVDAGAGGDGCADRAAPRAIIPKCIHRTAASRSASCRCRNRWSAACAAPC